MGNLAPFWARSLSYRGDVSLLKYIKDRQIPVRLLPSRIQVRSASKSGDLPVPFSHEE